MTAAGLLKTENHVQLSGMGQGGGKSRITQLAPHFGLVRQTLDKAIF